MAPCIDWGMEMENMMKIQKYAVESGYWPLYRYDPRKEHPFLLDSKKIRRDLEDFTSLQNRFSKLTRERKDQAKDLQDRLKKDIKNDFEQKYRLGLEDHELLEWLKKHFGENVMKGDKCLVVYGSETGHAEELATILKSELQRRGQRVRLVALDDIDIQEIADEKMVYGIISTAGQGDYPKNAKEFFKQVNNNEYPKDLLKDTKFAVFGLGDNSYVYYNKAAKDLDKVFESLGGQRIKEIGLGNDKDEDK